MKIAHMALWTRDLEKMRDFYVKYFHCTHGKKYHNPNKQFTSYFLSFEEGCPLEIMHKPGLENQPQNGKELFGYAHLAISVGSKSRVDELTRQLEVDGYPVVGQPRTTGDGYYESVVADPEGNLVEITE